MPTACTIGRARPCSSASRAAARWAGSTAGLPRSAASRTAVDTACWLRVVRSIGRLSRCYRVRWVGSNLPSPANEPEVESVPLKSVRCAPLARMQRMARLILLNGPPAAGKSTLARRWVADHSVRAEPGPGPDLGDARRLAAGLPAGRARWPASWRSAMAGTHLRQQPGRDRAAVPRPAAVHRRAGRGGRRDRMRSSGTWCCCRSWPPRWSPVRRPDRPLGGRGADRAAGWSGRAGTAATNGWWSCCPAGRRPRCSRSGEARRRSRSMPSCAPSWPDRPERNQRPPTRMVRCWVAWRSRRDGRAGEADQAASMRNEQQEHHRRSQVVVDGVGGQVMAPLLWKSRTCRRHTVGRPSASVSPTQTRNDDQAGADGRPAPRPGGRSGGCVRASVPMAPTDSEPTAATSHSSVREVVRHAERCGHADRRSTRPRSTLRPQRDAHGLEAGRSSPAHDDMAATG